MKLLIFTEGTVLMHKAGFGLLPQEVIRQVQDKHPSVHDYANYIPIKNAVEKLSTWQRQGIEINYLTSRRKSSEVNDIQNVLNKYDFPKGTLFFRIDSENYGDVVEKVMPNILIEDNCKSIGGESEMTYPNIRDDIRNKIKGIVVEEFVGIDSLTDF